MKLKFDILKLGAQSKTFKCVRIEEGIVFKLTKSFSLEKLLKFVIYYDQSNLLITSKFLRAKLRTRAYINIKPHATTLSNETLLASRKVFPFFFVFL